MNIFSPELRGNQEFQSGAIRIGLWFFMLIFIGSAVYSDYYQVDRELLTILFALHLVWFLGIFLSVVASPQPSALRRYLSALSDMSGASFLIWVVGDPLSPFYLLYIWSFVSQGTRYGSRHLIAAAIASVISYCIVLAALDGWAHRVFEVGFLLLLLIVLPLYEFVLLKRLHEARSSAEEANKARANFLATMTHELRTPLSAVIGMARLLRETRLDREQGEYVQAIRSSADVLQSVVGDILDLSKIDARKLELNPRWFPLRASLYDVVASLGGDASAKGLELICLVGRDVPERAWADELRFRQVLLNLASNAIKFTDAGHIRISAAVIPAAESHRPPELELMVEDTGIGISADQLNRIFDGFWQADNTSTRRHGGTGLGTTIARELTELMGGRIDVLSAEGQGTSFTVRLPILATDDDGLRAPRPPDVLRGRRVQLIEQRPISRAVLADVLQQAGIEVVRELHDGGEAVDALVVDVPEDAERLLSDIAKQQQLRPCPVIYLRSAGVPLHEVPGDRYVVLARPPSPEALWQALLELLAEDTAAGESDGEATAQREDRPAKVLVAEDDEINARLIQALLKKSGHDVTLVHDGRQALAATAACDFDIALIDLRMPVMDGMDFCRTLRNREAGERRLPVVALTANASEEVRADCLAAGMDDFIAKPVDPDYLAAMIARQVRVDPG